MSVTAPKIAQIRGSILGRAIVAGHRAPHRGYEETMQYGMISWIVKAEPAAKRVLTK